MYLLQTLPFTSVQSLSLNLHFTDTDSAVFFGGNTPAAPGEFMEQQESIEALTGLQAAS